MTFLNNISLMFKSLLRKTGKVIVGVVILAVFIFCVLLFFNVDLQQRLSRKSIEHSKGNYTVTYDPGGSSKSWKVINGKVTSQQSKGYYFFWASDEAGKKYYVQTPIMRSYIEENH